MRRRCTQLIGTLLLLGLPTVAHAQEGGLDLEVPALVIEDMDMTGLLQESEDLDLANAVMVAARYVTTIQEAPAIVTVITDAQLKQQNVRRIREVLDRVPGWMSYGANHSQFPVLLTRGTLQALLLIRDGVSMFDPFTNIATLERGFPIETVKRIEVVTGPGGVLWGANSFLGVVSVVSKGADDVNGVEASAGYTVGPAENNSFRGYVMAGIPDYRGTDTDIFLHTSFESFESPHFQMPGFLYHSPQPQPNSPLIYGPLNTADPARSIFLNFSASVTRENLEARVVWPFGVQNRSLTFAGAVMDESLPQDAWPECQGPPPPGTAIDDPPCIDRGKVARKNSLAMYDRFATVKWSDRFGASRSAGGTLRGYLVQFVRDWQPLQIMSPIATLLPGGLGFAVNDTTYRAGVSWDGDLDLTRSLRMVYGTDVFREWVPDRTARSRMGAGTEAVFRGPYDLDQLPLACPHRAEWDAVAGLPVNAEKLEGCPVTFAFESDRVVFGAYASAHSTLGEKIGAELGVRTQVAPGELSNQAYDTQLLASAALLYRLPASWNLKLNFTQGFRPPVFNNTAGNGQAVSIPGVRGMVPETSQAYQVELNARIKGKRQLREINFRTDYSYTLLENLILFPEGVYENLGTRGIHSAELLSIFHLKGGHSVQLGYTFLRGTSEDIGQLRSIPNQWFNLSVAANPHPAVSLFSALRVASSFEDPNRLVEFRNLYAGEDGVVQLGAPNESVVVRSTDLVLDRIPPSAMIELGLSYYPTDRFDLQLIAVNALDGLYDQPDSLSSFAPRLDILPNPYERFRANLTATYRY